MASINPSGIAHATLTVLDVSRTRMFYERLFKQKFNMDDDKSFSLLAVGIPCWFTEWDKASPNDKFDERRVGLDHIAFRLKSMEELEEVVNRLNEMGIRNAGVERFDSKYPYVAFRDPDNIQTEFFINEEL